MPLLDSLNRLSLRAVKVRKEVDSFLGAALAVGAVLVVLYLLGKWAAPFTARYDWVFYLIAGAIVARGLAIAAIDRLADQIAARLRSRHDLDLQNRDRRDPP